MGYAISYIVPIFLVVGIVSLVKARDGGVQEFYELLRAGRRSERWINLFGAAELHIRTVKCRR